MYNKKIRFISNVNGYKRFVDKKHPLANSDGTVYYHRHLASLKIGRWLKSNEVVHHIDGNKKNNSMENLVVLTFTEHGKRHARGKRITKTCIYCGNTFSVKNKRKDTAKYCSSKCQGLHKRKFNISKAELEKLVWEMPTSKIASLFGVSDNAISRRCKLLNIKKPGRGYWTKKGKNKPT